MKYKTFDNHEKVLHQYLFEVLAIEYGVQVDFEIFNLEMQKAVKAASTLEIANEEIDRIRIECFSQCFLKINSDRVCEYASDDKSNIAWLTWTSSELKEKYYKRLDNTIRSRGCRLDDGGYHFFVNLNFVFLDLIGNSSGISNLMKDINKDGPQNFSIDMLMTSLGFYRQAILLEDRIKNDDRFPTTETFKVNVRLPSYTDGDQGSSFRAFLERAPEMSLGQVAREYELVSNAK